MRRAFAVLAVVAMLLGLAGSVMAETAAQTQAFRRATPFKLGLKVLDATGDYYSVFIGGTQSANLYYTLPPAHVAGNLCNDGAGVLTWCALTWSGAAVNINASSNFATNINTGTSTGTVTIGSATTTQAIAVQAGTGDLTMTSTDDVTLNGGSAGSVINIGTNTQGNVIHVGDNDTTADTITIGSAKDTTAVSGQNLTLGTAAGTANVVVQSGTGDVSLTSTDDLIATITDDILLGATAGAEAAAGNVAAERCIGAICQTTLTLTAVSVTVTDPGAAAGYGSVKLYDFPEGYLYRLGTVADLAITAGAGGVADDFDGDVAFGSTADAGGGLAGTEVNFVASTTTPQAVAGVATADCASSATEQTILDGHSAAVDLYLTFNIDDADVSAGDTLAVTGTVTVTWIRLGDN